MWNSIENKNAWQGYGKIRLAAGPAVLRLEQIPGPQGPFNAWTVSGNTFMIRTKLKQLGFRWYDTGKKWYVQEASMTPELKNRLALSGVVEEGSEQPAQAGQPAQAPVAQDGFQYSTESPNYSNGRWHGEMPEHEKSYGFPANTGIHRIDLTFRDDAGIEHPIQALFDRGYHLKDKHFNEYYRRPPKQFANPVYTVHLIDPKNGNDFMSTSMNSKGDSAFDREGELLVRAQETLDERINDPKWRLRAFVANYFMKQSRDPELNEMISPEEGSRERRIDGLTVHIPHGPYAGDHPIETIIRANPNKTGADDVIFFTKIEDPAAPTSAYLGQISIGRDIKTTEQLEHRIIAELESNDLIEGYIEYLKKFPFLPEQKENYTSDITKAFEQMKSITPQELVQQMLAMGYIRPNSRNSDKYVLDSRKITDDAYYTRGKTFRPDFFISIMAYWIARQHRGTGHGMMLIGQIQSWIGEARKAGVNIDYNEVEDRMDDLGVQALGLLGMRNTDGGRRKRWQDWQDFYGGWDQRGGGGKPAINPQDAVDTFKEFAEDNGVDTSNFDSDPRSVYIQLMRNFHPDRAQDDETREENLEIAKQVNALWDNVEESLKTTAAGFSMFFKTARGWR